MTTYNLTAGAAVHEVDPISRIEGHLGVKVSVDGSGQILDANAHGNLWRGFENFLLGRQVNDAITFTQRICGVCPVPHGLTATYAADAVLGYSRGHITFVKDATDTAANNPIGTANPGGYGIPAAAILVRNLVLGAETLMSSITHFYHLAAPSYVQGPGIPPWTPYFGGSNYSPYLTAMHALGTGRTDGYKGALPATGGATGTIKLWDAVITSYVVALKMRRLTFEAGGLFAGRMPMTSCFVAGGVSNDFSALGDAGDEMGGVVARCTKFKSLIRTVGEFIVNQYVPIALALGLLYQDFDSQTMTIDLDSTKGAKPGNRGWGAGLGRFLSWGNYPGITTAGTLLLPGGVKDTTSSVPEFTVLNKSDVYLKFLSGTNSVQTSLTEDITHSRYDVAPADTAAYGGTKAAYPGAVKRTKPKRSNGYSYMKAPRWKGYPCEVGPLARLAVAGIYPVNGTTLTTIPGYVAIYASTDPAHLGTVGDVVGGPWQGIYLDPRVLDSTLATGLINSGVADIVANWVIQLNGGLSTMDRLRARALESLVLVQAMVGSLSKNPATGALIWANDGWIDQLAGLAVKTTWAASTAARDTTSTYQGWGAVEAPRGALMHQCSIVNGRITAYQCIVPTTWNASPKCTNSRNGAMESAMIGATFHTGPGYTQTQGLVTTEGGVEVLRIAQSFDPCIACAVH